LDDGVTPGIPGFFGEPAGSACALHAAMRRKRSWKSIMRRRRSWKSPRYTADAQRRALMLSAWRSSTT